MYNPPLNDRDYNLVSLIRQTRDAVIKARERELAHIGISSIQASLLSILKEIGNKATPAEISRRLVREPHSVSALLNRMEKKGLIRKIKDLPRKNMIRVTMTQKGKTVYHHSTKRVSVHEIMSTLNEDEKKVLHLLLEKLLDKAFKLAGITYRLPFSAVLSKQEHSLLIH
jgi:DNA-binding MarR family transcriptional regulator